MRKLWIWIVLALWIPELSAQRIVPQLVGGSSTFVYQKGSPQGGILATGANTFYSEDFEAVGDSFPHQLIESRTFGTDSGFYRGTAAESNTGQIWKVPTRSKFAYTNDDLCNCDKSQDSLLFPPVNITGKDAVILQFTYYFNRIIRKEQADLVYRYNADPWIKVPLATGLDWQTVNLPLYAPLGGQVEIAFVYHDGGGASSWGSGFALDDVIFCESAYEHDLAQDSLRVNNFTLHDYYKVMPRSQVVTRKLELTSRLRNLGSDTAKNARSVTTLSVADQVIQQSSTTTLPFASEVTGKSFQSYVAAQGIGQYHFELLPASDSVDQNPANDTLRYLLEVTDTTLSRTTEKETGRGFWFGPGVGYSMVQQIDLSAPDTVTSMSIYLHANSQPGSKIDLVLLDEFFQNAVDFASGSFHKNITIQSDHIGKWVTFAVPQSGLKPGKYYMGIQVNSGDVQMGVSETSLKAPLAQARRQSQAWVGVDYLPFVKLHFKPRSCGPIAALVRISKPNCSQANGGIHVEAVGGMAPYQYQWGANAGFDTDTTLTGLRSGHYTVTISDSVGCTRIRQVSLSDQGLVTMNTTRFDHEVCFGDSAGEIRILPLGGTTPYQITWSNGGSDTINDKLVAGVYTVTVTDAAAPNCKLIQSYTIIGPKDSLGLKADTKDNFCHAENNGEVHLKPSGGFGSYTFTWTDVTNTSASSVNLATGWYHATVTDANNCTQVDSFEVKSLPELVLVGVVTDNLTLGSITTQVSGGAFPYDYVWKGPGGFVNPGTPDLIELQKQGTYSLRITDSVGCVVRDTFQVGGVVSVTEAARSEVKWKAYPNPSYGAITLEGAQDHFQWEVVDMSGRVLRKGASEGTPVDFELNPGTYWIRINDAEQNLSVIPVVIL